MQVGCVFILCVSVFSYTLSVALGATLPDNEVEALKEIAATLGKTDWNFSVDPCSTDLGFSPKPPPGGADNVTCVCTFANSTICHVVSIFLKSRSLPGTLPPELVKLPYLQIIDLTRNYLNGSIPKEWGSMQLLDISLGGNRLSGSIPNELGNITSLKSLALDYNHFSGFLPFELGNLPTLDRLLITSNNLTGPLPENLIRLATLTDFRISDNNFSGKIPTFIQNLTNLQKLVIQGSGLDGPIPSEISLLTKITDLRISDLNGDGAGFPQLSNMNSLKTLILRSCKITGEIPSYIGGMSKLKNLDLSFNELTGQIPDSFNSLTKSTAFIYLTGNALTGPVPESLLKGGQNVDLSYNNFTLGSSESAGCEQQKVNLFGTPSGGKNSTKTGVVSCLKRFQCPRNPYFSVHINCGGREVLANGGTKYEDDYDAGGPSTFYQGRSNWAFSSTGNFMDNNNDFDNYIATTTSLTMKDYQLYTTARLSPTSLTYYGFCMLNGNYTVRLHFAEIIFTDDMTYSSLGRRIFDIYIQGNLVVKDFNIEDEAGGARKEVIKYFVAVVTDTTLEIRLQWAGKGTDGIPSRGTYGPLISAISVDPNFRPPRRDGNKLNAGIVVGAVFAVIGFTVIVLSILWLKGCFTLKNKIDEDLKGLDLQTGSFTLRQIKAATNNFAAENKIGEGGFGSVYKGNLLDGIVIAVKQLSAKSKQGNREFVNEIGMISALQHPHLVKLYGCCIEGNQLLLVYEYMENNSLARALFGQEESQKILDWPTRRKICVGIAKALAYLHEESRLKIVHRDIKATNVLLDRNLNAKVSDFGLAKLVEEDNTHISTRIAGTYGYMAPEYAMRGQLTDKADVYSFGIVALEIISGRSNTCHTAKAECVYLLDWALVLKENGDLMELVDPKMKLNNAKEEVLQMINMALQCTNASPQLRPKMSSVVSILEGEGKIGVTKFVSDSGILSDQNKLKSTKKKFGLGKDESKSYDQTQSMSIDGPWTGDSASCTDLYPISPDSQYWIDREKRSP